MKANLYFIKLTQAHSQTTQDNQSSSSLFLIKHFLLSVGIQDFSGVHLKKTKHLYQINIGIIL